MVSSLRCLILALVVSAGAGCVGFRGVVTSEDHDQTSMIARQAVLCTVERMEEMAESFPPSDAHSVLALAEAAAPSCYRRLQPVGEYMEKQLYHFSVIQQRLDGLRERLPKDAAHEYMQKHRISAGNRTRE